MKQIPHFVGLLAGHSVVRPSAVYWWAVKQRAVKGILPLHAGGTFIAGHLVVIPAGGTVAKGIRAGPRLKKNVLCSIGVTHRSLGLFGFNKNTDCLFREATIGCQSARFWDHLFIFILHPSASSYRGVAF